MRYFFPLSISTEIKHSNHDYSYEIILTDIQSDAIAQAFTDYFFEIYYAEIGEY